MIFPLNARQRRYSSNILKLCQGALHSLDIEFCSSITPHSTMLKKTVLLFGQTLGVAIAVAASSINDAPPAHAHALDTNFAFDLMQSSLTFTSVYSTGEPLQAGTVEIYSPENPETPWATLETDEDGRFSFAPDYQQMGEWTVKIEKEGHTDLWTVPVSPTGVEFNEVTQGPWQDVHYGSGEPNLNLWSGLLGAMILGAGLSYRLSGSKPPRA